MKNKNLSKAGFTLIELLVVVLIIGLLTSFALPRYQRAVWKSRAAALMGYVKQLGEAQERCFLATGSYAASMDELDVSIPSVSVISGSCGAYVVGWSAASADAKGFCVDENICICFTVHGDRRAELAYFSKGPYKNAGFLWNHSMLGLSKGKMYCRGTFYDGFGANGVEFCEKVFGLHKKVSDYWGKPYYPMN